VDLGETSKAFRYPYHFLLVGAIADRDSVNLSFCFERSLDDPSESKLSRSLFDASSYPRILEYSIMLEIFLLSSWARDMYAWRGSSSVGTIFVIYLSDLVFFAEPVS
jgi:hypothetical protein